MAANCCIVRQNLEAEQVPEQKPKLQLPTTPNQTDILQNIYKELVDLKSNSQQVNMITFINLSYYPTHKKNYKSYTDFNLFDTFLMHINTLNNCMNSSAPPVNRISVFEI